MIITKEILGKLGFDCNHPDYVLTKFHLHSKEGLEWNIQLENVYMTGSTELVWNAFVWKCNESGIIVKRSQTGFINTVEELNLILEICDFDWKFPTEV